MHIRAAIADDLSIQENFVVKAIEVARADVKKFVIAKKSGGGREIYHPSKKLKTIQYWLIHNVFDKLPTHDASMAYREGISILHNAERHRKNRFFLKMDLENFFPSIEFKDFIPIVRAWHSVYAPRWNLDKEAEEIIRKACFYRQDKLAIGYPSSPIISNVVMKEFDEKVSALIANGKFGNAVYTRYADDLIISTDQNGACKLLKKEMEALINQNTSPKIRVNHAKTRIGSSTGGTASVTGLKVCSNGHITIHRKQKDHIRLLLSLYKKGGLKENEERSLLGHIGYCNYVAPDFYTKISQKYFREIHELRSKYS